MTHWTDKFERIIRNAKTGPIEKTSDEIRRELYYVRDLTNASVFHEGWALTVMLGHKIECSDKIVYIRISPNSEIEFVSAAKDSWIHKKIDNIKLLNLPTWSMIFKEIKTWKAPEIS